VGLRIATLYDVHGNLPALEAVLAELDLERVDRIVFGGDLVSGPWPHETLERARSLGDVAVFVRGNTERLVLTSDAEHHRWARDRLAAEERELLGRWPLTTSFSVDGLGDVLFCHATPRSDEEMISPASTPERWAEALEGVRESVVVCGHTHLQFDAVFAGRRVVNPGAAGAPTVQAAAWWALLGPGVVSRTTHYDVPAMVAAARALGYPDRGHAEKLLEPPSRAAALRALAESGA
jgi:predicted phosphodiesterase